MELKNKCLARLDKLNLKNMLSRKPIIFVILIIGIICIGASNVSASITPNYVSYKKEPGECYTEIKTVEIPGTSIEIDVVFAFDLTGSMGEILSSAKSNIGQIINSLINTYSGASFNFGVISYSDYPAYYSSCDYKAAYGLPGTDYSYSLDHPLTDVITDVTTAIASLSLGDGWDLPEDYTRIFYESYNDTNIGWRTNAQKLLINFADSVPHDCNLNESISSGIWSTGGDPGPDEIMDTDDDLDLQSVLAIMNSNDITLIECHSDISYINYWEYWTGITGGSVNYINSTNFADVVEDAVTNKLNIPKIYDLTLEVTTASFEEWLSSVIPSSYPEVGMGGSVIFNETICVPIDTPPGVYEFNVSAIDGDGNNYGNQTNVIILNNPPVANDDTTFTYEDVSIWIDVLANDTDEDGTLDLSSVVVTSDPSDGSMSVNTSTGEIEYKPNPDFYGSDSFTYTVDDDDGATSNEAIVIITIENVNDPPIITTIDDTSADENELYSVDYEATDVDLDDLTWSLTTDAEFLSIDSNTGLLTGTPNNDEVGSYYANVTVDDGNGGTDYSNFTLIVSNVNDPPNTPINPKPTDNKTGVSLNPTLSVYVYDIDSDILSVSFYNSNDNLIGIDTNVSSGENASITWSGLSYSTTYYWYAIANDSELTTKSANWSFKTKSAPPPPPPPPTSENNNPEADASASGPYFAFIGEEITFDGSLSHDSDGYIVSWYWEFDDGTYEYGEIVTHKYSSNGTYHVSLTVTDDEGAKDKDIINVIITIANYPPENLVVDGPFTGKQNIDYNYIASAIDPDENDMLRFIFDWGDGTTTTSDVVDSGVAATVTHKWSTFGIYEVEVTSEDNYSAQISKTFSVLIDVIVIDEEIKGLIIDEDGNDPFDVFNNSETKDKTAVKLDSGSYLIDSNGDNKWDYAFSFKTGLITYYEFVYNKFIVIYEAKKAEPGFELVFALLAIALMVILIKRKRKLN